jgi:RNA polymerase sigma-70 factor (ECF subfamily)
MSRKKKDLFEKLYEQYSNKVYRLIYSITRDRDISQDIMQDVFVKVYKNLNKFRGESSYSTWIMRIAINTAYTYMKKNKNITYTDVYDNNEHFSLGETPESSLNRKLLNERIKDAINELKPEEALLLSMINDDKMNYNEIAEVLKIPVGTVKSRVFNLRKRLRLKIFGGEDL